jgi:hypothetical protein
MALVLFFLPALAFADGTDPQMDPNDCSGSLSITMLPTGFLSLDTLKVATFQALPTDFQNGSNSPSFCLANNTGGVIGSVTVSEAFVPTMTYGCPSDSDITAYFGHCSETTDTTDGLVLFTFSGGTGIPEANGTPGVGEFGFTEPGTDSSTVEQFTILVTPEPSTLSLLGTMSSWALWRLRRKNRAIS